MMTGMFAGVLLAGVLGVLVVTGEYTSGTIRATLAAAPRRPLVLAAKAAVFGVTTLITGQAAAFLAFFAGSAALGHGTAAPALGQPGVLRTIVLSGASLALIRAARPGPGRDHPAHRRRGHGAGQRRIRRRAVPRAARPRDRRLPAGLHRRRLAGRPHLPPRRGRLPRAAEHVAGVQRYLAQPEFSP